MLTVALCAGASAKKRKATRRWPFFLFLGGEMGIRTPDRLLTYTRFPGVRLQPLSHLSCNTCFAFTKRQIITNILLSTKTFPASRHFSRPVRHRLRSA